MPQNPYEIPFNNQLGEKLKDVLGDKSNRKTFASSRKQFNKTHGEKKEPEFKLPPLGRLQKDGVDHINIALNKDNVAKLVSLEDPLEYELQEFGSFNTMKGFWYYISTAEKDESLRTLTGIKLREYVKKLTPIKVKDFKVIILSALYEKIIQYRESDLLRDSTLPFDYYFVNRDNVKKRLSYSTWYVEGVEIIREALKKDVTPDFSKFKDEDRFGDILDSFKLPVNEDNFTIPRSIKNNVLVESFTKSLRDYKIWLCKPINRVKLQFTLMGIEAIKALVDETIKLNKSNEHLDQVVGIMTEICHSSNSLEYVLHHRDIRGNRFLSIFRDYKNNIPMDELDEETKDTLSNIEKNLVILDGVCIDKEGLHVALKDFVKEGRHSTDSILNYYKDFLTFLQGKDYVSEEFLSLVPEEYVVDNNELKRFLVIIKSNAIKEIYRGFRNTIRDYGLDINLIENLDDKDTIKSLTSSYFGNLGVRYIVSEKTMADLYFTVMRNIDPNKVKDERERKQVAATVISAILTSKMLYCYLNDIDRNSDRTILKEVKPTNHDAFEINDFLDAFRKDIGNIGSFF